MNLAYMLDTDTVSYWFRGEGRVREILERRGPPSICISAITVAELRFGAARQRSAKLHQFIDDFTSDIAVVPFDRWCAAQYALVATELAAAGTPIGHFDVLIAAHALTLDVILVTNNVKHSAASAACASRTGSKYNFALGWM
jgi:tRNA(fMet)-specific endonuclease VapC